MVKLKVLRDNDDGTADVMFDYDNEFIEFYKKETGKQILDDKEVGAFLTDMLYKMVAPTPNPSAS